MKKIFIIFNFLLLILFVSCSENTETPITNNDDYTSFVEKYNFISNDLAISMMNKNENISISPSSIINVLAIIYESSSSENREKIASYFEVDQEKLGDYLVKLFTSLQQEHYGIKYNDDGSSYNDITGGFYIDNSFWYNNNYTVYDEKATELTAKYNLNVNKVKFNEETNSFYCMKYLPVDEEVEFMYDFITKNATSKNILPLVIDIEKYIHQERFYGECSRSFYIGKNIKEEDINVTCTPLNFTTADLGGKIHSIKAALRTESNTNGYLNMTLGIWLDTKDIMDIIIKDLSSLGFNQIPNNILHQFLQCDYESYYLNNEDIMYDVNMFNFEESIGIKIAESVNVNQLLIDRAKTSSAIPTSPNNNYKFLSVIYDDLYSITDIDVDEVIKPTNFQYAQVDNVFAKITDNYVQVEEEGEYLIALKVNMEIHEGKPTKMTMSFFLNDDRIDETTTSVYLDPSNKVYPIGFIAGQVKLKLNPSDKLYIKARWSDKRNVFIENHCSLQITKL